MATAITLDDVKRELNITWTDAETDANVYAKWKRAEKIIERAAGRKIDFAKDAFAAQILFDCCRYLQSDAFAQFKIDYAEELLSLRLEAEDSGHGADASKV